MVTNHSEPSLPFFTCGDCSVSPISWLLGFRAWHSGGTGVGVWGPARASGSGFRAQCVARFRV